MDGTNEKCRELNKLMERHGKFVEFLCRWESYGRGQWCADLMQECFLELMRRLPERDARWGEAHEKAWVYWRCRAVFVPSVVRNRCKCTVFVVFNSDNHGLCFVNLAKASPTRRLNDGWG